MLLTGWFIYVFRRIYTVCCYNLLYHSKQIFDPHQLRKYCLGSSDLHSLDRVSEMINVPSDFNQLLLEQLNDRPCSDFQEVIQVPIFLCYLTVE